jgi:hypothetical protein
VLLLGECGLDPGIDSMWVYSQQERLYRTLELRSAGLR